MGMGESDTYFFSFVLKNKDIFNKILLPRFKYLSCQTFIRYRFSVASSGINRAPSIADNLTDSSGLHFGIRKNTSFRCLSSESSLRGSAKSGKLIFKNYNILIVGNFCNNFVALSGKVDRNL